MRLRRNSMVAVAMAAALVAAGCGDDGGGEDPGDEGITLSFSWWGSDPRHEATQEIIDAFEAQHEGITIEPIITDWSGYWDMLATATAGDNAPDIMTQEERYMTAYALNDQLLDLNSVSGQLDLSGIDPLAMGGGEIEGSQYAVATGVNAFTIVADPQVFADAGVEVPDDTTWTWEDFVSLSAEISAGTPDDVYGAQLQGTNEAAFNVYARQRGEALYNPDGSIGFSAQTLADWWQVFLDQVDNGGAPPADLSVEIGATGPDQSLLATNTGAMGFWWTNQLGGLTESSGRELVLLRQPGESEGTQPGMYFKPAMFYSVSSQTEHPEEAAMFVDFLLNSDESIDIMLTDRGLPANLAQRDRIAPELPEADQLVVDFMSGLAPDLADPPPPPPNGAGDVPDILQRLFEEVLFGQREPLEAAEEFIQEVEVVTSQ